MTKINKNPYKRSFSYIRLSLNKRNFKNIIKPKSWLKPTAIGYHLATKRFYGNLTQKTMRNLFKKSQKWNVTLTSVLERRIDVILIRLGYAISIYEARQIIKNNGLIINNSKIYNPYTILNINDIIQFNQKPIFIPKKIPYHITYQAESRTACIITPHAKALGPKMIKPHKAAQYLYTH